MQISGFSYNTTFTEFPTSKKGLESLSYTQLVEIAMKQQNALCKERVSYEILSEKCSDTSLKIDEVFTAKIAGKIENRAAKFEEEKIKFECKLNEFNKTLANLPVPKKQKLREKVVTFRNEFEALKLQGKNLLELSKKVKSQTIAEKSGYEGEDKLLRFMHEMPGIFQLMDIQLSAFENRANITTKMNKFGNDIKKSANKLNELMKTDDHDFQALDKIEVKKVFDQRKERIANYEKEIESLVKEVTVKLEALSNKQAERQHLTTLILNSKTQEKACQTKVSTDLSSCRKELRAHLEELNGSLSSLKQMAKSDADAINQYLSGVERGSFKTSMLPTLLGGTTTKEFVAL